MEDTKVQPTWRAGQATASCVPSAAAQTQPDPVVCFQGGPGEDDVHHDVHQGEPAPLPTGSCPVPAALHTHHIL